MEEHIQPILSILEAIRGLTGFKLLQTDDKTHLQTLEEHNNHGVKECLQKEIVLIALHDEVFRKPPVPEVIRINGNILFPPVPFPEITPHKAITGSPGERVHFYLLEKYYNNIQTTHATLLIGFNLERKPDHKNGQGN